MLRTLPSFEKKKLILIACFLLLFSSPIHALNELDTDGDGVSDYTDNCIEIHNPDQRDTDNDGYGNACDPDLDNDGYVGSLDLGLIEKAYGSSLGDENWNPDADFNGDGLIDMSDVSVWVEMQGKPPGPSFVDKKNPGLPPKGEAGFAEFPKKVEMFVGENLTVSGAFKSNLNFNLYDLTFSVEAEGLDPTWYDVSPDVYWIVRSNETKNVSVSFSIPENASIYTYSVTLRASAGSKFGRKNFFTTFKLLMKERLPELLPPTITPPEKKPLTGLYAFLRAKPWITPLIIAVILIAWLILKLKPWGEWRYVYGKGWIKSMVTLKLFQDFLNLTTKW